MPAPTDPASAAATLADWSRNPTGFICTPDSSVFQAVRILLPVLDAVARGAEGDRVAAVFERWSRPDYVRLHAGEMTAQEMRSVRAVLGAVRREVEAAIAGAEAEGDRVERYARAMCEADGWDSNDAWAEAKPNLPPPPPYPAWHTYEPQARAAIALADAEMEAYKASRIRVVPPRPIMLSED